MKDIFITVCLYKPKCDEPVLSLFKKLEINVEELDDLEYEDLNKLFINNESRVIKSVLSSLYRYENSHIDITCSYEKDNYFIVMDVYDNYDESKLDIIKYVYDTLFDYLDEFTKNFKAVACFKIECPSKSLEYLYRRNKFYVDYNGQLMSQNSTSTTKFNDILFTLIRVINPSILNKE